MKKTYRLAVLFPSVFVSSAILFASDSSVKDLSKANEEIK